VVAQELVHSMNKMIGRKGYFAIKVDLTKAYDMLRWDFITNTLQEVGIPDDMLNVIMHGVTSVKTNVKWHGARAAYFNPQRGIRQGDPISPYIFVICMDKLSHMISHLVNEGKWKGIKVGRTCPTLSHLMFADDLLLFGQATEDQMNCVKHILEKFCVQSGQKVIQEKTSNMCWIEPGLKVVDMDIDIPSSLIKARVVDLLGFRNVELRIDSQVVVNMLVGSTHCCPTGWSLCQKIHRLLQLEW
jgi:hypothetical protein